jgi:hypothetical protein
VRNKMPRKSLKFLKTTKSLISQLNDFNGLRGVERNRFVSLAKFPLRLGRFSPEKRFAAKWFDRRRSIRPLRTRTPRSWASARTPPTRIDRDRHLDFARAKLADPTRVAANRRSAPKRRESFVGGKLLKSHKMRLKSQAARCEAGARREGGAPSRGRSSAARSRGTFLTAAPTLRPARASPTRRRRNRAMGVLSYSDAPDSSP